MTGVVVLDKHEGITSFWAAAQLRRVFGEKKIGHTGTLDPMATGVLPVFVGQATRIMEYMELDTKTYVCAAKLGMTTLPPREVVSAIMESSLSTLSTLGSCRRSP